MKHLTELKQLFKDTGILMSVKMQFLYEDKFCSSVEGKVLC